MAHFYGSMQGARGEATRCGTKASGIEAHVRGWDIGARVGLEVDSEGRDVVRVFLTGGSNARESDRLIGEWTVDGEVEG